MIKKLSTALIGALFFTAIAFSENDGQASSKDTNQPTVESQGELLPYSDSWQIKFSKPMSADTVIIGNVNLYIVGASAGSLGNKNLANDILEACGWSYETKTNLLTIRCAEHVPECASCALELEFTDKIKDADGNKLIPNIFEL
ncbi:MAG: hypothetical protein Q3M24_04085 [Candidatus Electrothrix aestuarii]|uniref:SbsA Ig-like domain-containing protein n=1 Tax=Candidatus Electrothrix aestuarii TaxID=3062594 RepID=A0AAU8LXF6_9BACT|nr:hypothetical protein [Candidatus Electrothrix aestuarii]WPD22994.1 MAG: hypothetical protein SD837_00225 [Candidatus Electrothrix sp. GW3-3]